jgi:TRAP transporter T-component
VVGRASRGRPAAHRLVDVPVLIARLRRSALLAPKLEGAHALILLGRLDCARPIAIGGQPREGLSELERAAQLTQGHCLAVQVTMAVSCAVTLNERPMFDRLLRAVLDADTGTAFARENAFAKERARYLLAHADSAFPD